MNCEQVAPYLPGIAGGELGPETVRWVEAHLVGCASCRADAGRYRSLASGLGTLAAQEIEPPAFLADAIIEHVHAERRRRFLPVPPVVGPELVRVVQENREAIASAGVVIAAAGATYALWRAVRRSRPGLRPAAS
jgi:hypothetical protein